MYGGYVYFTDQPKLLLGPTQLVAPRVAESTNFVFIIPNLHPLLINHQGTLQ